MFYEGKTLLLRVRERLESRFFRVFFFASILRVLLITFYVFDGHQGVYRPPNVCLWRALPTQFGEQLATLVAQRLPGASKASKRSHFRRFGDVFREYSFDDCCCFF